MDAEPTDAALDAEIDAELGAEPPEPSDGEIAAATPEQAQAMIAQVEAAIAQARENLKRPRPTVQNRVVDTMDDASKLALAELERKVRDAKKGMKKRQAERDLAKWKRKNMGRRRTIQRALRKARRKWERERSRNDRRASRLSNKLAKLRIRAARKATGGGFNATVSAVGSAVGNVLGGLKGGAASPELEAAQVEADAADIYATVPQPEPEPMARQLPIGAIAVGVVGLAILAFAGSSASA
jgi:hypothetical protein